MKHLTSNKRLLYGLVPLMVVAAAGLAFMLSAARTTATSADWPALTMTYNVSNDNGVEERRLTYTAKNQWIEEVIQAPSVVTNVGKFSPVGSYQMADGSDYTFFNAVTGLSHTQPLEEGVAHVAQARLLPMPISKLEEYVGRLEQVTTSSKVCFGEACQENATGWKLDDEGRISVYADDARGIPLQLGPLVIKEVRATGAKQAIVRE